MLFIIRYFVNEFIFLFKNIKTLFNINFKAGPKVLKQLKDLEIEENKTLELVCEVSGSPSPSVSWFKGDNMLKSDDRIQIIAENNKHRLRIENVKEESDNGVYIIQFTNEFGVVDSKAQVTVLSKYFYCL